jgi:hypothetical protein
MPACAKGSSMLYVWSLRRCSKSELKFNPTNQRNGDGKKAFYTKYKTTTERGKKEYMQKYIMTDEKVQDKLNHRKLKRVQEQMKK